MTSASNNKGRAYEYACIVTLFEGIQKTRTVTIREDKHFATDKYAWDSEGKDFQKTLTTSAKAVVETIFGLEPKILEPTPDILELYVQSDIKGTKGDVRDIVIQRKDIKWEIGLSIKHNHFAVKHSRLGNQLDFGKSWYGVSCSEQYWKDVMPVFEFLKQKASDNVKWSDIPQKAKLVYVPLLTAFISEIRRQSQSHPEIPRKMVEYLLGSS